MELGIKGPFADVPRLENPYSVANMKKALASLQSKNRRNYGDVEIKATHYYVKFTPNNEKEYSAVKADSLIELYDHPLDVEEWIIPEAIALANGMEERPPVLWCAVAVGHPLPEGCPYEILEHLYIPDEDKIRPDRSYQQERPFAYTLVDEALRLTGNLKPQRQSQRMGKWRPKGRITVWDDNLNHFVGVEGVKVRARRWFTTHTGFTSSLGYYNCDGRFRWEANYSIVWERYNFSIQDGWLSRAGFDGPKTNKKWNWAITKDVQKYYATIFRAAQHYYYKSIKELRRPPQNSFWKTQLKIRAYNESNDNLNGSHCAGCRFLGLNSAIKMYNPQRDSDKLYGTTIHELAHASHWNMDRRGYRNSATIVAESWARGVE